MHFLSERVKSMQRDQFDTLCLTHVVFVVSGFRCECFLPNSFFLFLLFAERGWKWGEKYRWPAKKAKANVNINCFSLIKGQGSCNFLMSGNPDCGSYREALPKGYHWCQKWIWKGKGLDLREEPLHIHVSLLQGCALRKIEGSPVLWNCKI